MKFRLLEVSMVLGILISVTMSCLVSVKGTYDNLQENVLRMHILANSDSDEDQALKLKIRDALLEHTEDIFGDCTNIDEAESYVSERLELIKSIASDVVAENGYTYPIDVELVNMEFDDRTYGDLTMPSGLYDAVRVTIGNAEGHNWWCVMYPPMCVNAVTVGDSEPYFDSDTMNLLEDHPKYELKLKCLEWLEKVF